MPVAKLKTAELHTRLNTLRPNRREVIDEVLPKIAFTSRGLMTADPASGLGIEAIIAALRGERDVVDAIAVRLANEFPDDWQEQVNLMSTYCLFRDPVPMKACIDRVRESGNLPYVAHKVVSCLMDVGELKAASELVRSLDVDKMEPEVLARLQSSAGVLETLTENGVTDEEARSLINAGWDALDAKGWPFPIVVFDMSPVALGPEPPYAHLAFAAEFSDANICELEDDLLRSLEESNLRLFDDGLVTSQLVRVP